VPGNFHRRVRTAEFASVGKFQIHLGEDVVVNLPGSAGILAWFSFGWRLAGETPALPGLQRRQRESTPIQRPRHPPDLAQTERTLAVVKQPTGSVGIVICHFRINRNSSPNKKADSAADTQQFPNPVSGFDELG
jgi:hypothetical protein